MKLLEREQGMRWELSLVCSPGSVDSLVSYASGSGLNL